MYFYQLLDLEAKIIALPYVIIISNVDLQVQKNIPANLKPRKQKQKKLKEKSEMCSETLFICDKIILQIPTSKKYYCAITQFIPFVKYESY